MKKKLLLCVLVGLLCLAPALSLTAAGAGKTAAVPKADTVASATPNYYRDFSQSYLEALPLTGGYYSCLKSQSPYTFGYQDWYGVKLASVLDDEVGLADGTSGVRLIASDNYTVDLTLDRIRNANSQGLFTILAWQAGVMDTVEPYDNHMEPPLPPLTSGGPFRLALGQSPNVGPYPYGSPNYNTFLKSVRAIEIQPLPAGVTPMDGTTVPADQVIVYGNIEPYRITGINPTSGQVGQEVTISGFGFGSSQGTSKVTFGTTDATEYTSWGVKEIKCKVPVGLTPGSIDVSATTWEGASNTVSLTLLPPAPHITSLSKTSGAVGDELIVTGTDFGTAGPDSYVSFGTTKATEYTSWADNEIKVKVPTGAQTGNVTMTTPDGTSNGILFGINPTLPPAPHVTSISPSSAHYDDTVTIKGSGFGSSRGTSYVKFDDHNGMSYPSWSSTQIKVKVPSNAHGRSHLKVVTPGGTSTNSVYFYSDPVINGMWPLSGKKGSMVTISGSCFGASRGTSYVRFGNIKASSYPYWSKNKVQVKVPSGAIYGTVRVTITTTGGSTNYKNFTVKR